MVFLLLTAPLLFLKHVLMCLMTALVAAHMGVWLVSSQGESFFANYSAKWTAPESRYQTIAS